MFRLLGGFALASIVLALSLAAASDWPTSPAPMPRIVPLAGTDASPQSVTIGEMLVNADWIARAFGDLPRNSPHPRWEPTLPTDQERLARTQRPTFRSLCVRLCDGFYFPISYSTPRERFAGDAKQCEQRCPSRSRLFVHRNPGEDVDDMVDLQGRGYRNLPTAFLHRTRHVADCTCRGNPWDEPAIARHRAYAETARQEVAGKTADKPAMTPTRSLRDQDRWARSE